jgi:hypothetical protein
MLSLEALVVVVGWLVSLGVAVMVVPKLAAKRICEQFGLQKVTVNGRDIYAVEDLEGNPVKIPIGTKANAEGESEIVYGYAPLPMTMTYLAADQAAMRVKMALLNTKGAISKQLSKQGLQAAMDAGGGLESMLPFLPKKLQAAAALAQALGLGRGLASPTASERPAGHSGGGWKV